MQQHTFTASFFVNNRHRLLAALSKDKAVAGAPIIITANGLLQRNADNTYLFRQDSSFWYLTGIEQPDIVVVLYDGDEFVIVPTRDPVHETFDGKIDKLAVTKISGIKTVLESEAGWDRLKLLLNKHDTVATLSPAPSYIEGYQFYTNPARAALVEKIKTHKKNAEFFDVRKTLALMRVVKQKPEVAAIRYAVETTIDGLLHVTDPKRLPKYKHEFEIEVELSGRFRLAGCDLAFSSIVASGARATQMHNIENSGRLHRDDMIILDVGAEYHNYAADISRTVIVGQPSHRQQDLYDAVCEAQDYAYSQIKPGVMHLDYERDCARFIGEKLQKLGIVKDANDTDAVRRHFPHMMSHFVGLEAHDVGDYHQPMQAGTVMVVEPGMYSFDEGLGVRIEDVVLITDKGCEVLSRRMPRRLR